jgi:hypothetical protein
MFEDNYSTNKVAFLARNKKPPLVEMIFFNMTSSRVMGGRSEKTSK